MRMVKVIYRDLVFFCLLLVVCGVSRCLGAVSGWLRHWLTNRWNGLRWTGWVSLRVNAVGWAWPDAPHADLGSPDRTSRGLLFHGHVLLSGEVNGIVGG